MKGELQQKEWSGEIVLCICFRVRQARGKTAQTSQIEQEQQKNTVLEQAADDSEVLLCCSLRLQQLANTARCTRPISLFTVSLCSVGFSQAASPSSTCMCSGLCSQKLEVGAQQAEEG